MYRGRQNVPLDGQIDCSDTLSSSADPRFCGSAGDAAPRARCAFASPARQSDAFWIFILALKWKVAGRLFLSHGHIIVTCMLVLQPLPFCISDICDPKAPALQKLD